MSSVNSEGYNSKIVYYDNGNRPIFRYSFLNEGIQLTLLFPYSITGYLMIRALHKLLHIPSYLFYKIPHGDNSPDLIIVFDTMITPEYLATLHKRNKNSRIILWMWNPVSQSTPIESFKQLAEVWSYSPSDCEAYDLHYNSQFYFDKLADKAEADRTQIQNKYYFFGRDKGRRDNLKKYADLIDQSGAQCVIRVFDSYEVYPYEEILESVLDCGGILDIYSQLNAGPSLRVMESLFWNRKLITNNLSLDQFDFFSNDNIYIIGKSNMTIEEFIEMPYVPVDPKIKDYYRFSNWLQRFQD